MADWSDNSPDTTTQYADVLTRLRDRDKDAITLGNAGALSNLPVNAVRWAASASRFEKWTGNAWTPLANKYLINVDKLDGLDAGNASGNIPINNGALNTNLNADLLDGYHADTAANPNRIPIRDGNGKVPGSITGDAATVGGVSQAAFMRKTANSNLSMGGYRVDFGSNVGDKIRLYSNSYGLAINSSEFTLYHPSNATLRVRTGPSGTILGTVWHSGNDGPGSGLDADLIHGISGANLMGRFKRRLVFTTSGTYTVPSDVRYIIATLVGGGGGGNRPVYLYPNTFMLRPGGSGGLLKILLDARNYSLISITVGAGGASANSSSSPVPGSNTVMRAGVPIAIAYGGLANNEAPDYVYTGHASNPGYIDTSVITEIYTVPRILRNTTIYVPSTGPASIFNFDPFYDVHVPYWTYRDGKFGGGGPSGVLIYNGVAWGGAWPATDGLSGIVVIEEYY